MVLKTFPLRGEDIKGRPHQEGKFYGPLAEQETFAPEIESGRAAVEKKSSLEATEYEETALIQKINRLEDELSVDLIERSLQRGESRGVEQLRQRLEVERALRESSEVQLVDTLRDRKDCRSPGKHTSEEKRLEMVSPRNRVMLVEMLSGEKTPLEAIFKPKDGEAIWIEENGAVRGIVESRPQTGYLREWLAGFIAKALNSEVVPPTVVREINGAIGSVQLKVEGQPACVFGSEEWLEHARVKDLREVAVLDYLLENADRHDGNYFIGTGGAVRAIDHGLILPESGLGVVIRSFPLRYFSAGDRTLPEALLERLANLDKDKTRYHLIKQAFNLVFGEGRGEIFFSGFTKRVQELIKKEELPDYRMHSGDEKYFWGHAATVFAPPSPDATKIGIKHAP